MPRGPKWCVGVALAIAALASAFGPSRSAALEVQPGAPDLSTISKANREMIESACSRQKASYSDCARRQLAALEASPGAPDLSKISSGDQRMIDSACSGARYLNGPAAYYNCLRRQVAALQASPGAPDVSAISRLDQEMIESACGNDRYMHGPAAYYTCVRKQVAALEVSPGAPDLSVVSEADRRRIASSCVQDKSARGPAAYYDCLRQQLAGSPDHPAGVIAEPAASAINLPQQAAQASSKTTPAIVHEDTKVRPSTGRSSDRVSPRRDKPSGAKASPRTTTDSFPNSANPPVSSPQRSWKWAAGLVVLLLAAALAGVWYQSAAKKRCIRCGKPAAATGPYCPVCFDAVTEAAMREAEEEAMAEEERRARLPRHNAAAGNSAFDPYAVLGINRDASLEEIRAAYRREIVNCHPDKVAHLGDEFQELAKTKAQEINRAYEALAQSQ